MRDAADNCVVVCSIENFDPMGVHTGDSITVAPAQTLTDVEYQAMRDDAFACLRRVGVETGGSNVQFAVDPQTGRRVIIEMNPRVSRSSALASKATGFPIAKIAARLAVGYHLDEIPNDITRATPASFEPTIDYVVTKVPRWAFEKLPGTDGRLGTRMQSVGRGDGHRADVLRVAAEGVALARTGPGRAQRRPGRVGPRRARRRGSCSIGSSVATPDRIFELEAALRRGIPAADVVARTGIDPWFVQQIGADHARSAGRIVEAARRSIAPAICGPSGWASPTTSWPTSGAPPGRRRPARAARPGRAGDVQDRRHLRGRVRGLHPLPLLDLRGGGRGPTLRPRDRVVILGSGPNRIGQGIEFDYCCVHASMALRDAGYETVMINCNPETVSTDYDTSDRLYFEPLTARTWPTCSTPSSGPGEGWWASSSSLGGQTPLKLAGSLPPELVLGTSPASIDLAEDRERWNALCGSLQIPQPPGGTATSTAEALAIAGEVGYPVLLRPSYVLGGRAMEIVYDDDARPAGHAHASPRAHWPARAASRPSGPCWSTASWRTRWRSTSTPCATRRGRSSSPA